MSKSWVMTLIGGLMIASGVTIVKVFGGDAGFWSGIGTTVSGVVVAVIGVFKKD